MNLILLVFIALVCAQPDEDRVQNVPGYDDEGKNRVFSGSLPTTNQNRTLHYVFVESPMYENTTVPIVLWLNGGPGCSSMIGFLQEIGPYYLKLQTPYVNGDKLTENKYSWNRYAHMLFLDSPAGVGLSTNNDANYKYNDQNTASDAVTALQHFFNDKFEQLKYNQFYIAGESYAGKYIPDLALKINSYNKNTTKHKINLFGIFIGNGILDFSDNVLEDNQKDFMISHNFIDPKLSQTYYTSCRTDWESAGCQYFYRKYDDLVNKINPSNVYGKCYEPSTLSQRKFFLQIKKKIALDNDDDQQSVYEFPGQQLPSSKCKYYYEGIQAYFRNHSSDFHSNRTDFKACDEKIFQKYQITPQGSMNQMARIIAQTNMTIYLYSGDWDDGIPFTYTLQNIQKLLLKQDGEQQAWRIGDQHAGFKRKYRFGDRTMKFWIVKGAGHEVPVYQRQRLYQLFKIFLQDEQKLD